MVQKRMTRSLILLSFVLDVRRVEGHAHYSYPRHHSRNSQMCFRTLEWKKSNDGRGFSSLSSRILCCVSRFRYSCQIWKFTGVGVPSENRALVYFSHVVFCICQILPIFHSTELFWVAKRENRGGKKHDHFLSDAPCKSIVGTSNIFVCQKDH